MVIFVIPVTGVLSSGICLNVHNPSIYLLCVCSIPLYSFHLLLDFFYAVPIDFLQHFLRLIIVIDIGHQAEG
jgi:hypothetical protein